MIGVRWQDVSDAPVTPLRLGTMRSIATAVAEKYELTLADFKGPSRARYISHPRQEAMAEIYKLGRFSMPQIGNFFGGRDHTTVLHAIRAVAGREGVAA